jgi:hypothetical protein
MPSAWSTTSARASLLAGERDLFPVSPKEQLKGWRSLADRAARMRSRHHLSPHRSDLEGTLHRIRHPAASCSSTSRSELAGVLLLTRRVQVRPQDPIDQRLV